MEPNNKAETRTSESKIKKGIVDNEVSLLNVTHETDSGVVSVQLLEFKTSLLEAVEELRIQRDAKTSYEAQICKLALEKQELEWQKTSLQSQINRMNTEHTESVSAVKKQFQSQIRAIEGEKGKHELTAELKDKEIISLKEELKLLQLFKYSLEKKLSELEQKLQVQTQVKDSHLNQLTEVEKRFRTISKQFAMVKQTHEKLEQNVEEAMRLNKKLVAINKKQESTIAALKKDVERLNGELVKYTILSICRPGEENVKFQMKEQQLQELTQKLIVETEQNKKVRDEIAVERAQRQDLLGSLQHVQCLLQTQTEAVSRTEQQLHTQTEDYQLLKREHEMIQERSKEREEKLTQLIEEYKNTKSTLEKEVQVLQSKLHVNQEELKTVKEAYDHLHKKHQQLSRHGENGLKGIFKLHWNSNNLNCDVPLDASAANLSKDETLDIQASQVDPPSNCEQMIRCDEVEYIPDERTAECQEAANDGCSGGEEREVNVRSQADQTTFALPPLSGLQTLAPDQSETSESIGSDAVMRNQMADLAVKQETNAHTDTVDNYCSLSVAQTCVDSSLTKLSEPETRSVYEAASDPPMSEMRETRPKKPSLDVSDTKEHQTSDKQTPKTFREGDFKGEDPQNTQPETTGPQSGSPNNRVMTSELDPEDNILKPVLPDKHNQILLKNNEIDSLHSSQKQLGNLQDMTLLSAYAISETPCEESKDQPSQFKMDCVSKSESPKQEEIFNNLDIHVEKMEAKPVTDTAISKLPGSQTLSTKVLSVNLEEAASETKTEAHSVAVKSAKTLDDRQNSDISFHLYTLYAAQFPNLSNKLSDAEKQITEAAGPNTDNSEKIRSSTEMCMDTNLNQSSTHCEDIPPLDQRNNSSAPSKLSLAEPKPVPSGFQELLASLNTSLLSQHKPRNRAATVITWPLDKANVSSIHPDQKSDLHGEWNAIKRPFSEKEDRVPISFGSAQSGSGAANGPRPDSAPTPPPRIHCSGKVSPPASEGSTHTTLEKHDHQWSDIRAQISKIECFLSSEGFRPQKRRKIDNPEVLKP